MKQAARTRNAGSYLGRGPLRALLLDSVERTRSGRGAALLLPGEPGIGKTRTLELLGELAAEAGCQVARGACSEVAGAPAMLPWAQVLDALDCGAVLREASIESNFMGDDSGAHFRLFRAVTDALVERARQRPLAVLIDDAHAADVGSAKLLAFVAQEASRVPLLLSVAYRAAEVPPDHALRPSLEAFGRRARTLPLEALETSDLALLASDIAGRAVAPQVTELLQERSQGNPLFAIQLVELLLAQGCDVSDPRGVDRIRVGAPEGVRHVLRARMEGLTDASRRALEGGAVLGREFDVDLLAHVASRASLPAPELDAAARAGIVVADEQVPGRWRFAHVLFRDVLVENLEPTPRRALHRHALEAIAKRRDLDEDRWLAAAAFHALESLTPETAPLVRDLARRAGERALARHSQEDAIGWFEGALRALELETDLDPEERAAESLTILPRLGTARWRSGQAAAARADFARALELARKVGDARAFAAAAVGFVGRTDAVLGPEEESSALLVEALERLDAAPSRLRVDVVTRLASSLYFSPDEARREKTSLAAVACAEALGDPDALAYALTARHYVLHRPGRLAERRAVAARTLRVLQGRPENSVTAIAHLHAILDHLEEGDLAGVDRHVQAYGAIGERLREPFLGWQHEALRATQALATGDLAAAEERAHRALELGREAESPNAVAMFSGHLFCLRRAQGRLGELEPMLAPLAQEFPDIQAYGYARAEAQLALGREGEVREFLAAARADLPDLPVDFNWPVLVSIAARLAAALDDTESAALLYEAVLPASGRCVVFPFGSGWDGAVDLSLGRLAAVLGRSEDADRHLRSAAALHARIGARLHLAETWTALAALRSREGDGVESARLSAEATALFRDLGVGGAQSPATKRSPEAPARFARSGSRWQLSFRGEEARFRDALGLGYLAQLLARPGEPVHVLDLTARREKSGGGDAGEMLDARARAEVRARMLTLQRDLDEAEAHSDLARTEALRAEFERLEEELVRALGLGGRSRRVGDPVERARKAVYARIRTALGKIEAELPDLARHLRHSIRTGRTCTYAPEGEMRWEVEA